MTTNWEVPRNTQVEVEVLANSIRVIETTDRLKNRALVHHHCRHPNVAGTSQHLEVMLLVRTRLVLSRKRRSISCYLRVAARNEGALRVGLKTFYAPLECVGEQAVISIQEYQVVAPALTQTAITRRGKALIMLTNVAHRRVAGGNLGSTVCRAIVDHNNFELRVALCEHAFDSFAQIMALVVTRDDHRYQHSVYELLL